MKANMSILKEHSWRRMALKVKGVMGCAPLATGVDWGSRMMKTVVLQPDRHVVMLHDFSVNSVPHPSLPNDPSDAELVETIRNKISVPIRTIGTALSGPSVFIKTITLPVMTEEDVRNHLTLELDRYIAFDAQDVFWDVYHQESLPDGTIQQPETFLVVAKKDCVERQIKAFAQGGVTVSFVDVDAFALTNLVTHNYGKEGIWLLVHIGPTGMVMVGIDQGEPAVIRKTSYEAEWYGDLLDQVLLPQTSLESIGELGASETLLLEQFHKETRGQIVEMVESFSDYSHAVIDKGILLSGGYAVVPQMAATLAASLSLPVQLLDPFQSIMVPQTIQQNEVFQKSAPLMGVAVGVALRGTLSHD